MDEGAAPPGALARTAVVGVTGAGKSTLARSLAQRLDVAHIELDALYWGPNWTPAPRAAFRQRLAAALASPAWVADGNYTSLALDLIWPRASAVVWLDYRLPVILWRLTGRIWKRVTTREVLWNDNRETWWDHLLSRDSLYLWALKSHARKRREYQALLGRPEHAHLHVVRLPSPQAANSWLAGVRRVEPARA